LAASIYQVVTVIENYVRSQALIEQKARGNILVDISWKDGELDQLTLNSASSKTVSILYGDSKKEIYLETKMPVTLNNKLN
jgi:hypothetical protein